jgi:replicative DNA helicase
MILPHSEDIENKLLSSIILMPENIDKIIQLKPEDFYLSVNQKIFCSMLNLSIKNIAIDLVLLGENLKENGFLDSDVVNHLSFLSDEMDVAMNPYVYSKKVKDYSKSRHIALSCMKILDKCKDIKNPDEIIDYAQNKIMNIEPTGIKDKFVSAEDLMIKAIKNIEKAQETNEQLGIDIGLSGISNRLFIHGSKLIFLAGRPGLGKTALMLAMAKHIALQNIKTGIISIEMDSESLADRMISSESEINSLSFYKPGKLDKKKISKINDSCSNLSALPILFNDSKANIRDVVRRCRKLKKDGCRIIFIDQLSKIRFDGKLSDYQGFSRNCNILAELKKELRLPIVVLCQIGRIVEESANKRPELWHLKQTGSIEEDADIVLFVYRPGHYKLKNNTGEIYPRSHTEIILAKVRNGIPGSDFTASFNDKRGYFILNYKTQYGGYNG